MAARVRLPIEDAWLSLAFQGYTRCAGGCGRYGYCCGVNPSSRVCLTCFELVFAGHAPNMRRRRLAA